MSNTIALYGLILSIIFYIKTAQARLEWYKLLSFLSPSSSSSDLKVPLNSEVSIVDRNNEVEENGIVKRICTEDC